MAGHARYTPRRTAPRHAAPRPSHAVELDQLYRREFHSLVALAYGLSGSRTAAEELVQEAFLSAHRRWGRIRSYDDPAAWLRRVVANRSVSVVRRRMAEARALTRLHARPSRPELLPEQDEELWRAVRRLPARQATALVLHYVNDCSVAEIAAVLGCSEGTVKTHLHRGRQALADALAADAPGGAGKRAGHAEPGPARRAGDARTARAAVTTRDAGEAADAGDAGTAGAAGDPEDAGEAGAREGA